MAKGNDGNYLQRAIEATLCSTLAALSNSRRIHVALTHGMEPFESSLKPPPGQTKRALYRALEAAQNPESDNEPDVVRAFRATGASLTHYPNSAELLAALVGRDHVAGGITETAPQKYARLKEAWSGFGLCPSNASWRLEVRPGGVHWCPDALQTPWLFSADPMTYSEHGEVDDSKLYRSDLPCLAACLKRYVESARPGVAILLVYAVRPKLRPAFWSFVDDLAQSLAIAVESLWVTHQGGNRNLAAVFASAISLRSNWIPSGVTRER
jgi:hypothetical protein